MSSNSVAYAVAKYLADSGFGTLGTDIHVGYLPDNAAGVAVVYAGGQPHKYVPIDETVCDIYSKNTNAEEAEDKLVAIKNFIHRMHSTDMEGHFAYSILAIGDIEDVQRDQEYSKVYKLTIQLINRNTSLIS